MESLLQKAGFKTAAYSKFEQAWNRVTEIAQAKVQSLLDKHQAGKLSEAEEASYLGQAMQRQAVSDSISVEDMRNICVLLMTASVDTTAGMVGWHLLHLSQNPHVQERIHSELTEALKATNGVFTIDTISSSSVPYLHATIRESHRLTSPATVAVWKTIPEDFEVHGVSLPAGSTVAFRWLFKRTLP